MGDTLIHWLWRRLTVSMLRRGFAEIYMRHFLASEFNKLPPDHVGVARTNTPADCAQSWRMEEGYE